MSVLTFRAFNKEIKSKKKSFANNHGYKIFRPFDI